jgi:glutaredoxin/glutathione-dependent peroxiredoxin
MSIEVGSTVPSGTFKIMTGEGPKPLTTDELFKGKKVLLFSVPGAFTPTCSGKHLPGYVNNAAALKAKGIDTIACMAVNDVFVMDAWGKSANVGDKIVMLADGNGDYARALDLEMDGTGFGMGKRSKRFSMIVEDGVMKQLNIEPPGQFDVSGAECALRQL